jgi:hypothetical protein
MTRPCPDCGEPILTPVAVGSVVCELCRQARWGPHPRPRPRRRHRPMLLEQCDPEHPTNNSDPGLWPGMTYYVRDLFHRR